MKSIQTKQFAELEEKSIGEISHYMDKILAYYHIDILNWPIEFPYKPICKFKIAHSKTKLYIKFYVNEDNAKAQYMNDMEAVSEDSCVEFFCKLPEKQYYFNFEFNCIGTCLAKRRTSRNENIILMTDEELQQIERYSSFERKAFEISENIDWTLTVGIPFQLIGFKNGDSQNILFANFYKCGDKTKTPHYLSWNLINTEHPDFHKPEYFGKLMF